MKPQASPRAITAKINPVPKGSKRSTTRRPHPPQLNGEYVRFFNKWYNQRAISTRYAWDVVELYGVANERPQTWSPFA